MSYILLEDEPITALALKSTLSSLRPDWALLATSDLAADIPSLIMLKPDLILSDLFLCDGPCTEVLEKISCAIPLVLFSGYPPSQWHEKRISNIIAFIEKPVSRRELEQVLLLVEKTLNDYSHLNN